MRKGFTLVEMLVVVVVLVTLMSMTFKLTGLGKDQSARTKTIARVQRLENCLSGYYAAFGSYPPVKLHGRRNIYLSVNSHDIQDIDGEENESIWGWYRDSGNHGIGSSDELRAWRQVRAACRAQPIGCAFPHNEKYRDVIAVISAEMQRRANSNDERDRAFWADPETKAKFSAGFTIADEVQGQLLNKASGNKGAQAGSGASAEWRDVQIFKFGLMSYLLPRYLVMMAGHENFFQTDNAQWCDNNILPCDPFTGEKYKSWTKVQADAIDNDAKDRAKIANIPSESVCARWMPNLEKSCSCRTSPMTYFGIDIADPWDPNLTSESASMEIFSPDGNAGSSTSDQYVLDSITMKDGWGQEIYYYSPAPYQTYTVWSAGPNGRTFPPWIDRAGMEANANKCIGAWTEDDIIHMSN